MNFNQWKTHAAKKNVSRVTYCCGEEQTLVELVLQDIKSILDVPDTDYVEVDASSDFWATASIYPLDDTVNRLVVIRNAEKVISWQYLAEWLIQSKNNPQTYLLFLSYDADAPSIYSKGKRVQYQEHIDLIRTKGKFIKCSTPNDEDMLNWVRGSSNLSEPTAKHLLDRAAGDIDTIYSVLKKLDVWQGSPNSKVIDLLCPANPTESFVDAIVLRNRQEAFTALAQMTDEDKSKIIARLDARLDMIYELGKHVRRRTYHGEIAASTGIKIFLVKKFANASVDYDFKKVKHCRQVLAVVDAAYRQGVKTGLWETIIALW